MKSVLIIQNSYQPSHTISLNSASNGRAHYVQLKVFKEIVKIVLGMSNLTVIAVLTNYVRFLTLRLQRKHSVFVYLAPYDWRMIFVMLFVGSKHDLTIVTSQLYWDNRATIKPANSLVEALWWKLIPRCNFVGLNDIAYQNAPNNFKTKRLIYHTVKISNVSPSFVSDAVIIGYAGRLVEEKGINVLLDAAKIYQDIEFHFAGWGPLGKRIAEMNLPNTFFHGKLEGSDLFKFYSSCDYITQLSTVKVSSEGDWQDVFGLSVAEAICFGCIPMITNLPSPMTVFTRLSPENLLTIPLKKNMVEFADLMSILDNCDKKESKFQVPKLISDEHNRELWAEVISI